ncbi:amidophosphoribosyltransferase [Streptosporangium sp. NBC_01495]|uniref:amidophosphoribosyltransferase n=1 Tax=Streptosporangium sp. NBC_01495 TaxID=2903899 RepID=UPI002E309A54|nr:amidophosphoribosyltransferase [Streptosporangium sp. NBC_01495]
MCGIVGVSVLDGTAGQPAFDGLVTLQHRGQESWGIAVAGPGGVEVRRSLGFASRSDRGDSARDEWPAGRLAVAHTRYSTTGATLLENSQPLVHEARRIALAHNGDLTNAADLRARLGREGYGFHSTSDSEVILALLANALDAPGTRDGDPIVAAVARAMRVLRGAYSVVCAVGDRLVAFRDPHGMRPLVAGFAEGRVVVASETCTLDALGCSGQREVEPGELLVLRDGRLAGEHRVADPAPRSFCVFEHLYLTRQDSRIDGARTGATRVAFGERLALESPADADLVVAVPASGVPAARGYARAAGLPLAGALVRDEQVGRTFIEPDQRRRERKLRRKFSIGSPVDGARVVVVDDSIVRGSTMRRIVTLLRESGASEVHVRIAAPALIAPCHYGVDIVDTGELVATGREVEEVCRIIGATSLAHLSVAGMRQTVGSVAGEGLCEGCITGEYPTPVSAGRDKLKLVPAQAPRHAATPAAVHPR